MLFTGGFSFANFLADVLAVFLFVVWFWLIISTLADLLRRRDISGWVKALWIVALILMPYLGVFVYLITQGVGMAERRNEQIQNSRDELRHAVGFSTADELDKLERLKKSGSITEDEFVRLRKKLID